jgi:hypothetical protein
LYKEFDWLSMFRTSIFFSYKKVKIFKEAVGDSLEELWISYNNIEKLKGINVLKKLKVIINLNFKTFYHAF